MMKKVIFNTAYLSIQYVMHSAIWYHLYNLKNVKNIHWGVLILLNFTKINTPPWVFFTFFKLYKWYQIAQRITYPNIQPEVFLDKARGRVYYGRPN